MCAHYHSGEGCATIGVTGSVSIPIFSMICLPPFKCHLLCSHLMLLAPSCYSFTCAQTALNAPMNRFSTGERIQVFKITKGSTKEKALTFVLSSLLFTATVLEGLFREYHPSSAALGYQRPEVTKQPLVCDWSATCEALCHVNHRFARNTPKIHAQKRTNFTSVFREVVSCT